MSTYEKPELTELGKVSVETLGGSGHGDGPGKGKGGKGGKGEWAQLDGS